MSLREFDKIGMRIDTLHIGGQVRPVRGWSEPDKLCSSQAGVAGKMIAKPRESSNYWKEPCRHDGHLPIRESTYLLYRTHCSWVNTLQRKGQTRNTARLFPIPLRTKRAMPGCQSYDL